MQYERPCSNSKYFFNNRFYLADQIRNVLLDLFSFEYSVQIWIGRRVLTKNSHDVQELGVRDDRSSTCKQCDHNISESKHVTNTTKLSHWVL